MACTTSRKSLSTWLLNGKVSHRSTQRAAYSWQSQTKCSIERIRASNSKEKRLGEAHLLLICKSKPQISWSRIAKGHAPKSCSFPPRQISRNPFPQPVLFLARIGLKATLLTTTTHKAIPVALKPSITVILGHLIHLRPNSIPSTRITLRRIPKALHSHTTIPSVTIIKASLATKWLTNKSVLSHTLHSIHSIPKVISPSIRTEHPNLSLPKSLK